jgi:hypothetical protein
MFAIHPYFATLTESSAAMGLLLPRLAAGAVFVAHG